MNGKIIFNQESQKAMFALLQFMELEFKGNKYNHKEVIIDFHKYCKENELTSPVIMKCGCKCDISNRELIFNVCLHCKGPVQKNLLGEVLK